ncbi:hypothetical protein KUTeg_006223 [Tegillarca granosa]|uniref:Uncharacterized protein n=1 Tax=Tegillarca granosa TaxID=220873 RepID=A0ABQ9FFX5_TEGGR|nr:hypothetical protein KUTeg_006223 [Tegillarca granosa]
MQSKILWGKYATMAFMVNLVKPTVQVIVSITFVQKKMAHVRMDVRKHFMAIVATITVLKAVNFKIAFRMELAGLHFVSFASVASLYYFYLLDNLREYHKKVEIIVMFYVNTICKCHFIPVLVQIDQCKDLYEYHIDNKYNAIKVFYGERCEKSCPTECKDKDCNGDGKCFQCNTFHYGKHCTFNCSNCIDGFCNKGNGTCVNGFRENFRGSLCNDNCSKKCKNRLCFCNGDCKNCVPGTYGNLCEQNCPKGCKNANCSRGGICYEDCVKGYYGEACSSKSVKITVMARTAIIIIKQKREIVNDEQIKNK